MQENNAVIRTTYAKYLFRDGILYGIYEPNTNVDLNAAKFLLDERLKFTNSIDHLFLVDLRNLKSATPEARKFFSTPEGSKGIIAGAFLIDSFLSKLIGNFYLKINPPPKPTKLFTLESDAINWLRTFDPQ